MSPGIAVAVAFRRGSKKARTQLVPEAQGMSLDDYALLVDLASKHRRDNP